MEEVTINELSDEPIESEDVELQARWKRMKRACFRVLFTLCRESGSLSCRRSKAYFLLGKLWHSLQTVSLLAASAHVETWTSVGEASLWVQFVRPDTWLTRAFSSATTYLIIQVYLCSYWALLGVLAWSILSRERPQEKPVSRLVRGIAGGCNVLNTSCYISLVLILIRGSLDPALSSYVPVLPVGSLLVLPLVNYGLTIGYAELSHGKQFEDFSARAHSQLEAQALFFALLEVSVFALSGDPIYVGFCILFCEGYAAYSYLFFLPFYNAAANIISVLARSVPALCSVWVMLGLVLQNGLLPALLAAFVTPLILYILATQVYLLRLHKITPATVKDCASITDYRLLELGLRKDLHNDDRQALRIFSTQSSCCAAYLVVWEVYYCLDVLDDYRIGRIKLTKSQSMPPCFEAEYQVFLANNQVEEFKERYFEDVDYVNFKLQLDRVKREDCNFCLAYLKLLQEFLNSEPSLMSMMQALKEFSKLLHILEYSYTELLSQYAESNELIDLFSSYLSQVLRDSKQADLVCQKKRSLRPRRMRHLSYFDDANGVLIVSGIAHSVGRIIFGSKRAAEILDVAEQALTEYSLNSFIPAPFNNGHDQNLHRFLNKCIHSRVQIPRRSFIRNSKNYLVEIDLKIKCTGIQCQPFFLVLMRKTGKEREILLLDDDLTITGCTAQASTLLYQTSVTGRQVRELLSLPETLHDRLRVIANGLDMMYREKLNGTRVMRYITLTRCTILLPRVCRWLHQVQSIRKVAARFMINRAKKPPLKCQRRDNQNSNMMSIASSNTLASRDIHWSNKQQLNLFRALMILLCILTIGVAATLIGIFFEQFDASFGALDGASEGVNAVLGVLRATQQVHLNEEDSLELLSSELDALAGFKDVFQSAVDYYPERFAYAESCYIWEFIDDMSLKEDPVLTVIDRYLTEGTTYLTSQSDGVLFLVANGNAFFYNYLAEFQSRVLSAEVSQIQHFVHLYSLITLAGFIVSILLIMGLVTVAVRLRSIHVSLLRKLVRKAKQINLDMYDVLTNRLQLFHSMQAQPPIASIDFPRHSRISKQIGRVLIQGVALALVAGLVYLVYNYTLIWTITDFTMQRLDLLAILNTGERLSKLVGFWTGEVMLGPSSVTALLSQGSPLSPASLKLDKLLIQLQQTQQDLLQLPGGVLLDDEVHTLFEAQEGLPNAGLYEMINLLGSEAHLLQSCSEDCLLLYEQFMSDSSFLYECIEEFISIARHNTHTELEARTATVLYIFGIVTVFFIALVSILSIRFVQKQQQMLAWASEFNNVMRRKSVQDTFAV